MGMGLEHVKDVAPGKGNDGEAYLERSRKEIADDLYATTVSGKGFKRLLLISGGIALVGLVALVVKWIVSGGDQASWGYVAAMLSYVVSVSSAGPIIYLASFLAKGYWGRALSRISLLFIFGGLVALVLLIPLTAQLPSLLAEDGIRRRTIWFEAPAYSPHFWGIVGMLVLLAAGMALFYLTALPDLVMMRLRAKGWRGSLARVLSRGWMGSDTQWRSLKAITGSLAVVYILSACFVHLSISADYDMSLVPGWRDAIYPVYHIVTGMQLALAGVVLAMYLARRYMGMKGYIGMDHFWLIGRFMLSATLGWFYLFFSGFIVYWYGRSGADIGTLDLIVVGPYLWVFLAGALFAFVLPWWWLLWNPVRRSVRGPVIGACFIMVGLFLDRIRLFVPAWSVPHEQVNERFLRVIPGAVAPDVLDVLIMVGALAGVVFFMAFATRLVPIVPLWGVLEYRLLVKPVKYLRSHGVLIAKPD